MFILRRTALSICHRHKAIPWRPNTNIYRRHLCTSKQTDNTEEEPKNNKEKNEESTLMVRGSFEQIKNKNRNTYLSMVNIFVQRDVHRRNHVEFIYAALRNMESFGVHRDLEVYKALIDVLPKGKFIPTNIFQSEFMHFPKQQQCIIDVLEQMEDNAVIPDYELESILLNIFGKRGHPVRKFWRMMYWMPKFKNLSPWLLPNPVPDETLELARLAVERMCSVDVRSVVTVLETSDVEESIDNTWIVSGISVEQSELLKQHDNKLPLYIEGPFLIWLRNRSVHYFTLRGDAPVNKFSDPDEDLDDVRRIRIPKFGVKSDVSKQTRSVHEQDDGTIFAICVTGSSTKDSLLSWIRLLEKNGNPALSTIPILFKFKSPVSSQLATTTT